MQKTARRLCFSFLKLLLVYSWVARCRKESVEIELLRSNVIGERGSLGRACLEETKELLEAQ